MTKIDQLKKWILSHKRPFSTVHINTYGRKYFQSAPRRARELAETGFMRVIPRNECIERKLWKKGQAVVRWYENN
jgi:hypothetical protein